MLRFLAPAFLLLAGTAFAAEGMWTFDNFPIAKANRELGTNIDQAWLDRVAASFVRHRLGGLVLPKADLTNEHVVSNASTTFRPAAQLCEKASRRKPSRGAPAGPSPPRY